MKVDFDPIMGMLLSAFGDEVDLYFHQGYEGDSDEFWYEDQDWDEENPETYPSVFEEQISEDTAEQAGFTDEAEAAVWLKEKVGEEGDRVDYQGRSYLVISTSTFRSGSNVGRHILGVRTINV